MMHQIRQGDSQGDIWASIEPVLNNGMADLASKDREVVFLRYFEKKSFKEVGRLTGTNEDTAQKRVGRATEKLKEYLRKHGVAVPVGVIASLLTEQAVQAAPVTCRAAVEGLLQSVTAAGVTGVGLSTTKVVLSSSKAYGIYQGALKAILISKVKAATITAVAAVMLAGAGVTLHDRYAGDRSIRREGHTIIIETTPQQQAISLDRAKVLREKWRTEELRERTAFLQDSVPRGAICPLPWGHPSARAFRSG